MYTLVFSNQTDILCGYEPLHMRNIYPVGNASIPAVVVRQGGTLTGLRKNSERWEALWKEQVFPRDDYPLDGYPWLVTDRLLADRRVVVLKHPDGVRFYEAEPGKGLVLTKEDGNFHDVYGYELKFGWFYPDVDCLGVMARDTHGDVTFYVAMRSTLSPGASDPLLPLDVVLTLGPEWKSKATDLFVTNLQRKTPEVIALRTSSGLEFFRFDGKYSLRQVLRTSVAQKAARAQDDVFFADLTHEKYQDILQLNSSGLYLFAYRQSKNDYEFIHRHGGFTEDFGWSPKYRDTIALADINGDSYDDLLFTGPKGLTALSFDYKGKNWKKILSPDSLLEEQSYSSVVGFLPDAPNPSVFTQTPAGDVSWAKVVEVVSPASPTEGPPPTEPTPVKTKTCPTAGMEIAPGKFENKPILRWIEQWNRDSLKDAMNTQDGEVRFSLPLIDTYAISGWGVKLDLAYKTDSSRNSLVGESWSLPLDQNFITMDRQNSVLPEDYVFYMILQGQVVRLKVKSAEGGVQKFHIASTSYQNYEVSIEFRREENRWLIEDSTELTVYGQEEDALQWSLYWPNWSGAGRDKTGLKPQITSWYLKMRSNKNTGQKLHYSYQNEHTTFDSGKTYTSAIWLKSISDGQDMRIDFHYKQKGKSEFTVPNPVSSQNDILFPVPLSESNYLEGYNIVTPIFSQSIQFDYDVTEGKRLLKSMNQGDESLLKFQYRSQAKEFYLTSIEVPSIESKVKFEYESQEAPTYTLTYPVSEEPKVVKGQNYTIMGYRHSGPKGHQVALHVLTSDMTRTIHNCLVDSGLSCPKLESEIKEITVVTFENSFVVHAHTKSKHALYMYNRRGGTWSGEPTVKEFGKATKLFFSGKYFVAFEQDENRIVLFHYKEDRWLESVRRIGSSVRFTPSRNFVATYDDNDLRIYYVDGGVWNERVLFKKPGLKVRNFVDRFDIDEDIKQKIVKSLEPYTLQAFNNVVMLSAIGDEGGQLYSTAHLFFLGQNMNIGRHDLLQVKRENLFQFSHETSDKGGHKHISIGYVNRGGTYRLEVKNAWGSDFDKIKKKRVRDKVVKEFIEKVNADKDFREAVRKQIFMDFSYYVNQMSETGVYCGKDTLLRNTGNGWQREDNRPDRTIELGKKFKLKQSDDKKSWFLYRKNESQPTREFKIYSSDKMVNAYPSFIANQPDADSVEVLLFSDGETLGQSHRLVKEQLVPNNNGQTLMTLANVTGLEEPMELRIRPLTYFSPKTLRSVSRTLFTEGQSKRLTSYRRSVSVETNPYTVTQVFREVPGGDETKYGYHETTYTTKDRNTTKIEKWFDAGGHEVYNPEKDNKPIGNKENSTDTNPSHLLDRNKKWLISDFTPYSLAEEMAAFYGFEDYESDQISSSKNVWHLNHADIIKNRFSFTGKNYLQLKNNTSLEGTLMPLEQEGAYLASCWLRSSTSLELNKPSQYLKAIIHANDEEIVGLLAQVKNQMDSWSYLELVLDFKTLKEIYKQYVSHHKGKSFPPEPKFNVRLKVQSTLKETIHLDHIRFFPLAHDFSATVYHPLTGRKTEVIQANGLVRRYILNRYLENIGEVNERGLLTKFSSKSMTGKLPKQPSGNTVGTYKPNRITIESETGFHESFDPLCSCNRWDFEDRKAWKYTPGQLWHESPLRHKVIGEKSAIDSGVAAIRCYFILQESLASLRMMWNDVVSFEFRRTPDGSCRLSVPQARTITPLPTSGEVIVMHDDAHAFLWFDGVLLFDQSLKGLAPASSGFSFEATGRLVIEGLVVMNRPSVKVEYQNALGGKSQVIELEDAKTALVTETLYDELGRGAITTKTSRISRSGVEALLAHRPSFVTNDNPEEFESVWITGRIRGEVDTLNQEDEGFPYSRTTFAGNPLHQETAIGQAGREFSVSGKYATRISRQSDLDLINVLFPESHGYHQKVQQLPNKSVKVMVFDEKGNQVAKYVRVPGYDHSLSTYEYNQDGRLIKILPPAYHKKASTAVRQKPWSPGTDHLTEYESKLQVALGTHLSYDKTGNLLKKVTPDSNTAEYVYNTENQIQLMIFSGQQDNHTVYMDYDARGQLWRSGYFKKSNLENGDSVEKQDYQLFHYSYDQKDPLLRGRIKQCITQMGDETIVDKMYLNADEQIISKETVATFHKHDDSSFKDFKKQYKGERLHAISYPLKLNGNELRVVHSYNRLGQLVGLGTSREPNKYAKFAYHPSGQLVEAQYQPGHSHGFVSRYGYSSPGFLERISNPFLAEEISFTEHGYGQGGFGDGMVTRTAFKATWTKHADGRWFQVDEGSLSVPFAAVCLRALKRLGYLSRDGHPVKMFFPSAETRMPLVCGGKSGLKLALVLAQRQPPRVYGHLYAYGTHQELTMAKYFTDETRALAEPLQRGTFAKEIPGFTERQSHQVWDLLIKSGFILIDQKSNDPETAIGKQGVSFLSEQELLKDLSSINSDYIVYLEPIGKLIASAVSERKLLSTDDFEKAFLQWEAVDETTPTIVYNKKKHVAREIGQMLEDKGYLKNINKAFNEQFRTTLSEYKGSLPDIVRVLRSHFTHALGESAFDVESYDIDPNGNHRLFYTGHDRYEMLYSEHTNQIRRVLLTGPTEENEAYDMKHDHAGNVVQALHKGIRRISYHPVSQRTTGIERTDGTSLRFYYDTNGERVLKRVLDAKGRIKSETHYLRDEKGKVLMDKQIKYKKDSTRTTVTAYLYGPKGLFGFVRNNKFYFVTTDYGRSVRLVINEGKVVAAYDYLPYGQVMRTFGDDPDAHIVYRYSGQEWDQETGLYNFHARLYDPSIGRFYQPDPKMQYFSPYKYAGNSPVSLRDPDGEFAWFIVIAVIFAIAGAYLGGAAANGKWNPLDWDWKSPKTWLGMFKGAITGVTLPLGFAEGGLLLVAAELTASLGQWYLSNAAASGSWNPAKWDWKSPAIYYSIFESLDVSSGFSGLSGLKSFGKSIISLGKRKYVLKSLLTIGFEVGFVYKEGVEANGNFAFWEWDWTSPETWQSLLNGMNEGGDFAHSLDGIYKRAKRFKKKKASLKTYSGKMVSSLYSVGSGVMGCIQDDKTDFTSFDTYQNFVNGVLEGDEFTTKWKKRVRKKKLNLFSVEVMPLNLTSKSKDLLEVKEVFPDRKIDFLSCHRRGSFGACYIQMELKFSKSVVENNNIFDVIEPSNSTVFGEKAHEIESMKVKRSAYRIPEPVKSDSATSGSSKPQPWGMGAIRVALSLVPFGFDALGKAFDGIFDDEVPRVDASPELESERSPEFEGYTSPGLLELGDEWLERADLHGLLAWGVLLAKKWTGFKEPARRKASRLDENVQLSIRSYALVDEFIEALAGHLEAIGISSDVLEDLADSKTYQKAVKEVGRMLSGGRLDSIPRILYDKLVRNNWKRIAAIHSEIEADQLLQRVASDIPRLRQRFRNYERNWFHADSATFKCSTAADQKSDPLENYTPISQIQSIRNSGIDSNMYQFL